jgi:hypothetical protein
MNFSESPLTVRQGIAIASRALCLWFPVEALANATYFPGYVIGAVHASKSASILETHDNYFLGFYLRYFAAGTLRIAVELYLAGWLYRCGPKVRRFLLGDAEDSRQQSV